VLGQRFLGLKAILALQLQLYLVLLVVVHGLVHVVLQSHSKGYFLLYLGYGGLRLNLILQLLVNYRFRICILYLGLSFLGFVFVIPKSLLSLIINILLLVNNLQPEISIYLWISLLESPTIRKNSQLLFA
jgi:hypothetical protein